jgi:carboxyl-terminal processing protease
MTVLTGAYPFRDSHNRLRMPTNPLYVVFLLMLAVLVLITSLGGAALHTGVHFPPGSTLSASGQRPSFVPVVSPAATARQMRVFTRLWEAVRDTYVDADLNGVDWDDVGQRYRTRIELGMDEDDFGAAMREMMEELGDDHSVFHPAGQVAELARLLDGKHSYAGVGIIKRTMADKGHAVLLNVAPGGPAERAGLRRHDRILAVDGQQLVDEHGNARPISLRGPAGSQVELTVQTPGQAPRELVLTRAQVETRLQVEARRLPGTDVGYLLIPTFWYPTVGGRVRQELGGMLAGGALDGLIIDLRINGGGLITSLADVLSIFIDGEAGAFVSRDAPRSLTVKGRPVGDSLGLPLVVLVGRETQSAAEILGGVLQERGRAHIIGRTTAGNVETVWKLRLRDGSEAWIAREIFFPPSGANWETTGIVPDTEIALDWDEFTNDNDPQLEAALDWLLHSAPAAVP